MSSRVSLGLGIVKSVVSVLAAAFATATSAQVPAALRVQQANFMSPTSANTWYGASTTHTNHLCGLIPSATLCTSGRAKEIKALARTLGAGRYSADAYSQAVLEYIYANIATEFRYGLGKGALGTLLDQSGTPFDQAHLMVELLREGGLTANYQAGTITLNGTQFNEWTGITNRVAACRLLADGGIPASIAGSTSAGCSYSGSIGSASVVLGHIWVQANGKLYDPSYKKHTFKTAVDLYSATGCTSSSCATSVINAALPAASQGSDTVGSYVQNVQTAALSNLLQNTYARNLESYINVASPARYAYRVEDIVGGKVVNLSTVPIAAATLPYTSSVQRTWTGDIPDQYRSRLRVQFDSMDIWLYADELSGYALTLVGSPATGLGDPENRWSELHLDGNRLAGGQASNASYTTSLITLTADHPYYAQVGGAGAFGAYMDEVTQRSMPVIIRFTDSFGNNIYRFEPLHVANLWGDTGAGRIGHASAWADYNFNPNFPQYCLAPPAPSFQLCGAAQRTHAVTLATWGVQVTAGTRLVDGINNTVTHAHHTLGAVSRVAYADVLTTEFLDLRSSISVLSKSNTSAQRLASIASTAVLWNAFEGSVGEQMNDAWGGQSSIGLFGLANRNGVGGQRFYNVTSTNVEAALTASQNYSDAEKNFIRSYVATGGFSGILSQQGAVGSFNTNAAATANVNAAPFYAFTTNGLQHAYVSTGQLKGAGTSMAGIDDALNSVNATNPKKKDPIYSVDLASGSVSFSPPPDMVVGTGAFPSSLPFRRFFQSGYAEKDYGVWVKEQILPSQAFYYFNYGARKRDMASGWRHNYEIEASIASDAFQAMGADSALDASTVIAGLQALRTLATGSQTFQRRVAQIFVAEWLKNQISGNSVNISRPPSSSTFVRLPSGAFNPPPGTYERLAQTGSRVQHVTAGGFTHDYATIEFTLTTSDGGTIRFNTGNDYEWSSPPLLIIHQMNNFKADRWTFPDGMELAFAYQEAIGLGEPRYRIKHLSTVANSVGRQLSFDWSTGLTVSDGNGRTISGMGAMTNPLGTKYEFTQTAINSQAVITQVFAPSDSINPMLTFAYDALGRLTSVTDKSSHVTSVYPGKVSTETFARAESVDAAGGTTTTYYDQGGRPLQVIDPVGRRVTTNTYDGAGRLVQTFAPEGNSTLFSYDIRSNKTEERVRDKSNTSANDRVSTYTYFTAAGVVTCPPTETKRCNQPTSVNGPRTDVTDVTSYTYNQSTGQVATMTGPSVPVNATGTNASPFTSYTYTLFSANPGFAQVSLLTRTAKQIDTTATVLTEYTYYPLAADRLAPMSMIVDFGGLNLTTQVSYDAVGNVRSAADPRGNQSYHCFDAARRLVRAARVVGTLDESAIIDCNSTPSVATGDDLVTVYEYSVGDDLLKTRQRDTDGDVWRDTVYTYTPTKSLDTVTDPQGNVTNNDYDALDRLAMVTDAAGRRTRTFYFADGKMRKILRGYQFTAADSNEACSVPGTDQQCYAQYSYAPSGQNAASFNGEVYSIADANGNATNYTFDIHDRPLRTTFPGGTYEEHLYDSGGNLDTLRNRAGEIVDYSYDALNRVVSKVHASFPAVSHGYDLLSRQTVLNQTGGQAVSYVFDKAGRLSSTTAGGRTTGYQFDATGNRTRLTWPDGFYVQYTYDAANRMDQVFENGGPLLADYSYDTLSRRKDLARGNGDTTSYGYEPDNDLSGIVHGGLPGAPTFSFTRNGAHQLLTSTVSDATLSWTPTASSNVAYVPNTLNQYASVGGTAFTYDLKGNLTADGASTYAYDAENRLTQAARVGVTTTYAYDGLGRRISKNVGSTITQYLLDGDEEIAEYNGSGSLLRRFVYGPSIDDRISMYADASAASERYYYTNHQGSTVLVADALGGVTDSFAYSPYGVSTTGTGNPFQYTGRRYDAETDLYYYRARYYSPVLGRFLQTDPIGYEDGFNLYVYAHNDPVNNTDPSGMLCLFGFIGNCRIWNQVDVEAIDSRAVASAAREASNAADGIEHGVGVGNLVAEGASQLATSGTLGPTGAANATVAGILTERGVKVAGQAAGVAGTALDVVQAGAQLADGDARGAAVTLAQAGTEAAFAQVGAYAGSVLCGPPHCTAVGAAAGWGIAQVPPVRDGVSTVVNTAITTTERHSENLAREFYHYMYYGTSR
jgi:RHS repeat-associated protein